MIYSGTDNVTSVHIATNNRIYIYTYRFNYRFKTLIILPFMKYVVNKVHRIVNDHIIIHYKNESFFWVKLIKVWVF